MLIALNQYGYIGDKKEPCLILSVETFPKGKAKYTYISSRGNPGYLEVYNYHSAWNQYKDSKNYIPTWMKEIRSHLVEQQNNN